MAFVMVNKGKQQKNYLPNVAHPRFEPSAKKIQLYKAAKLRDEVAQLEREQVPTLKGETCP